MPKGKRKSYSKEFKINAVYLMLAQKYSTREICELLSLDRQTVHRWVSEFKANGTKAFDNRSVLAGDVLSKMERQKVADLEMEVEILKKAIAYFGAKQTKE